MATSKPKEDAVKVEDPMQQKVYPGRDPLGNWQPGWCTCCGPEIHIGDDKEIVLTLEEPWHGRAILSGREMWSPMTLSVCLSMDRDGIDPFYEFGIENRGAAFSMTGEEVDELISALIELRDDARRGMESAHRLLRGVA